MSNSLIKFLSELEKKDLLRVVKSVAKFPIAEDLVNDLKKLGLEINGELAEELCSQFKFPMNESDLEAVFGGYFPPMDDDDWEYFSQHPEYGIIRK